MKLCLGNSMGLEVDGDDVEELVEEHSKELSTEELLELHKEQNETLKQSLTSEESGEEEDKEESRIIPAKDLKDAFFCWSKPSKHAEDYHPDVGSVQKAIKGGGGSLTSCWDCCEGTAVEMILRPEPTTTPPLPPPLPLLGAVVVVVVEGLVSEAPVLAVVEDTGNRSGRSSSISWLCTCSGEKQKKHS
ncbi:hypothetical protein Hamer_G014470 [Homarus americanus]|uniref:Uncharacterized protein n=1 Tax=Homarus americanus TaxID=6706 RepID=A0A8J5JZ10_HOMAM|nr:hypothetical protein Hamer_G014470 [Homarus americanus]